MPDKKQIVALVVVLVALGTVFGVDVEQPEQDMLVKGLASIAAGVGMVYAALRNVRERFTRRAEEERGERDRAGS